MPITPNNESPYLDRMYQIYNRSHPHDKLDLPHSHNHPEQGETTIVVQSLAPRDLDKLKINALKGIANHMCLKSMPCDHATDYELEDDVRKTVDRYFTMNSGKILQYFNDTKNTVTDVVREAIEDVMKSKPPLDSDDEEFVTAVVDKVSNDEDVETVVKQIEGNIKQAAEKDIKEIIDDVKEKKDSNGPTMNQPAQPMITTSPAVQKNPPAPGIGGPGMESVFHYYLMEFYKNTEVPSDPEEMLVGPMIETSMHYVSRVLFNDGFARKKVTK